MLHGTKYSRNSSKEKASEESLQKLGMARRYATSRHAPI